MAIPPSRSPNILGILGGDLAGYPNGRRVFDDVFTIELRAIAGATIPLVDPSFTPDGAAGAVTDGVTPPGNVTYRSARSRTSTRPSRASTSCRRPDDEPTLDLDHVHDHARTTTHARRRTTTSSTRPALPPAGGPVVVDIGDDVGALIVATSIRPGWDSELHVRRDGETHTTHTGIWERRLGDRGPSWWPCSRRWSRVATTCSTGPVSPVVEVTITGGQVGS